MALGQGINQLLDYKSIAEAGQPQDLTGDALIELGALFAQMDFDMGDDSDGKGAKVSNDTQQNYLSQLADSSPGGLEFEHVANRKSARDILANFSPTVLPPKKVYTPGDDQQKTALPNTMVGGLNWEVGKTQYFDKSVADRPLTKKEASDAMQNNTPFFPKERDQLSKLGIEIKEELEAKDDNPIKRVQQNYPQIFKALQGLRYKKIGEVDSPLFRAAHIANSPFVKTDGVDYRYMKRATIPEYAKRLGGAAAEGYNLVIDKYNYDQAVKKDYETELDDEMGSLIVDADTVNEQTRKDYLDFSIGKKKQAYALFQARAKNEISHLDYKNGMLALDSEIKQAATVQSYMTDLSNEWLEKKGTYDIDASDAEITDFFNTLEKNKESFSLKTIDGVDYFVGKTLQNKEVKAAVSKIANGTAGFRLVEKASITPVVSSALKAVNSYAEEGMTDYGFGKISATPERAKQIGVANIKNVLAQDESKLRSFMATIYGVNHATYQNFIGDDPTANREEMLNDAAEHLYETQVKPQFFPTQKTTRIDPSKIPFIQKTQKSTAGERTAAEIQKQINSFPPPTPENVISDWSTIIDKTKYKVQKADDNNYYITDLKDNPLSAPLDFNKPNDIANMFANIAGLKGKQKLPYSLPK